MKFAMPIISSGDAVDNNRSGIYEIINVVNGHRYIGSAINLRHRWKHHKGDLRNNIHHSWILQRAWNKYGGSSFIFKPILYCDPEMILIYEQLFIDGLQPEYNIEKIAGSHLGCKRSDETKRKMSIAQKGHYVSEMTRQRLIDSHKGYKITEETKRKMSEATKGKYRGWSDKSISQFSKDGQLLSTFHSVMDAERKTGIGNGKIVRCAKGKRRTAGGFIWRYASTP
jgi:group I intron endonuclease